MERNRDARRGPFAAVNSGGGGGLSRRRQRNSSRDSPYEDDGMEMPETSRLRDRGVGAGGEKKYRDRDRDRSGRSKRRFGERMLHGSSNRDDVDDSSEDSLDDEDEDDEDNLTVRKALPSHPPVANPSSSPSSQQQQNHHNHYHHHHRHQQHSLLQQQQQQQHQQQRKNFPPKAVRPPVTWKADEMIGVAVPRKARSASAKRSLECSVSGGVGEEEQILRQNSASPSRLSPASTTQISPSSSNVSIRKKKQMSGNKHQPPKISKASSSVTQDDIEMEVAEILFGLTRQHYCPSKEISKVDTMELNDTSGHEARSSVCSPSLISPSPASRPLLLPPSTSSSNPSMATVVPKRKKPRPVKFDDENPGQAFPNSPVASPLKLEVENLVKTEAPSPRSEKNNGSQVVENGDSTVAEVTIPRIAVAQADAQLEATGVEINKNLTGAPSFQDHINCLGEATSVSKATSCAKLDVSLSELTTSKKQVAESPRKEKFNIDLMAPPPGKLSPDGEDGCNFDSDQKLTALFSEMARSEKKDHDMLQADQSSSKVGDPIDKSVQNDMETRKQMVKEQTPNMQLDLEKAHKDDSIVKPQIQKQQQKAPKVEAAQDISAPTVALNMPMAVAAWPGGFPPFGYMGQVASLQGLIPMDGSAVPSNALQSPAFIAHQSRQKRCATHFYIAQTIHNYQRLARMNPFWSAANANPIYGTKPYNFNAMPPSDASVITNPFQGGFPGRHMVSVHDTKSGVSGALAYSLNPSDKIPTTNNSILEVPQKKQVVLQQTHTESTTNMLHGPALIFPANQQRAATEGAPAGKSTCGVGSVASPAGASSSAAGSSGSGGAVTPVNLSFTGLSARDAQYLAMFQNNPYPFSLPPHVAGTSPFRGVTPAQAMPYFFSPHILHPSQIQPSSPQQQLKQQQSASSQPHAQQNHQKPSTSSGSSSSQKNPTPSHLISGIGGASTNPHGGQRQQLRPQHALQHEIRKGSENPSSSDGRASSHAQKGMYGQAFPIPVHHQNFSLMSSDAVPAVVGNAGGHNDKQTLSQQPPQKQNVKMDLRSPPAFGAVLSGLDFSSMSQNHTIFQMHPEATRHGHHQITMASKVALNNKQTTDDGKSVLRDPINGMVIAEDERKTLSGSKLASSAMQHSPTFSKHGETSSPMSSIANSCASDSSSRTLNLIPAPANGSRIMNRPLGGAVTNSSVAMGTSNIPVSHQHHQQMLQLQKQQQHLSSSRAKMSVSTNSSSVHSDHLAGSSSVTKFPQPLTGFPQAVMQDGSLQSTQIKISSGRASTPMNTSSSASPIVKSNHLIQQQVRSAQQLSSAQSHQTQISFGINPLMPAGGQHFSGASGNSSAGAVAAGSPSNSVSKSASGSPKPSPATVGNPPQSSSKVSASSSNSKTPVGNVPSILGHSQNTSSTKLHQQQLQAQKQQSFPQAQFYFTNAYMHQAHTAPSNAATAGTTSGYYQKRQADQWTQQDQQLQQLQHASVQGSSGMFGVCPSGLTLSGTSTSESPKAIAASNVNNIKVMAPSNLLHPSLFAAAQPASGFPHATVASSFPYMSMPAMSVKVTADKKPAGGNDTSWQSGKR